MSNYDSIATQENTALIYESYLLLSRQVYCALSLMPQGAICQLETSDYDLKWCKCYQKNPVNPLPLSIYLGWLAKVISLK